MEELKQGVLGFGFVTGIFHLQRVLEDLGFIRVKIEFLGKTTGLETASKEESRES